MEQKFFSAPVERESVTDIAYHILRRNETTGELEPMKGEFKDEETCKMLASFMNYLSYNNFI